MFLRIFTGIRATPFGRNTICSSSHRTSCSSHFNNYDKTLKFIADHHQPLKARITAAHSKYRECFSHSRAEFSSQATGSYRHLSPFTATACCIKKAKSPLISWAITDSHREICSSPFHLEHSLSRLLHYRLLSSATMPEAKPFERLPTSVLPKHYDITLKPDLKQFVFTGQEKITVQVKKEVDKIILNALNIEIQSAKFQSSSNKQDIPSSDIQVTTEDERATISFPSLLPLGEGVLSLEFTGQLSEKMKGFYRSKYYSLDGDERYGAVTQFESTDARRAFPCWDEPALKATFDMTLIVPKDRVALSNMHVVSEVPYASDPKWKVVKYATTPVMSTYLVACVVGEYDYIEGHTSDGVCIRVYTPLGKKEQGQFALEVAVKTLPFYKDYFNVEYPLSKMDLVAIADFASGAMENWGLVTYRERCLLVDSKNTSADRKQFVGLIVGHELAHQWFGNLVTMEWWTHLWLNEGFASFIEYLCVDHLFPEYDIWTQFVSDPYLRALELDALRNSHPIEIPVGHPCEIDEIFDEISYDKGASVIRMLHRYISDECFRKGMHIYLTRHKYKNTQTEDLWQALEEASNKPVAAMMSTWTKQKGYPVISVSAKQEGQKRVLQLKQEKFCADGAAGDDDFLWMVPVSFSTSAAPTKVAQQVLLDSQTGKVTIENVEEKHWIKVNPGAVGYFRVHYTSEMIEQLIPAVIDQSLPPLDRLSLQNDVFAMVQSGRTSTIQILKLLNAYVNERNYTVWSSINSCLGKLSMLLSHTDFHGLFLTFGCKLLSKIHTTLGWDPIPGESHLDTMLRGLIINRLVSLDDEALLAEAKKRFQAHANGTCPVPADLRSAVYRGAARNADDETFQTLMKLYKESDLQEEKDRISRALAAVKDEARIKAVLDFAMSSDVRSQDTVFVIISVALNRVGRELAWQFVQDNKDELRRRYEGGYLISRLIKYVTEDFASEEKAQEVEAFFAKNPFPGAERTVQQALETIRLNAKWLARDSQAIHDYLKEHQ